MTSYRLKINSIVYPQRETGLEENETGFKEGWGGELVMPLEAGI